MNLALMTGIDVIEIDRIARAHERFGERFLHRVFTDREIQYCLARPQRLAGRFASKEAASKALGVGVRGIRWRDIEILPDRRGKPQIYLHGKAAAIAADMRVTGFDVSITHSRSDAIAVVVAWRDEA